METPELTATCQRCRASLTLPLPEAFVANGDTLVRGVDLTDTDARQCTHGQQSTSEHPLPLWRVKLTRGAVSTAR
jgi:hypothetical protein